MPKSTRPLMKVSKSPNGVILFTSRLGHGSLDAEILRADKERLHITHFQTIGDSRRQGIATALVTSTIRGASAVQDKELQKIEFQVTNPIVVPLLDGIFGESVAWYVDQDSRDSESNGVDVVTALTLAASRKEQAEMFKASGAEFPDDFEPGVHAVATVDHAMMAGWIMPNIISVDSL